MRDGRVTRIVVAALLCAIGIAIPMISPFKIVLEPASFTLGSHVAIFIAMFISPVVALAVALGTATGFFFGGFPVVVTLRALSHVVFAVAGALIFQKRAEMLNSPRAATVFSLVIALVHAICEMTVVTAFYFMGGMGQGYYASGFVTSVLLLVGLGTVVHSMVDFGIALAVWTPVRKYYLPGAPAR